MATSQGPQDPWSRFVMSVFAVSGQITRVGENIVRPIGQTSARWQVLGRACLEPQTVAQMARDMGHARQSVQRVADVLIDEGLIVDRAHPTDKRTLLLAPTRKGLDVMAAIYERQVAWSERVMPKLDPVQLAALTDALQNVAQILELEYQEE